jgi:hypothetical protein
VQRCQCHWAGQQPAIEALPALLLSYRFEIDGAEDPEFFPNLCPAFLKILSPVEGFYPLR